MKLMSFWNNERFLICREMRWYRVSDYEDNSAAAPPLTDNQFF
jgi:hypothetical protein